MALVSASAVAADLGGFTATVTTGAKTVHATAASATLFGPRVVATVAASTRPTAALYDTDGVTWLAALPLATGIQFQVEVNQPGSLSLSLPLNDSATALATPGRFFKVSWRGRAQIAARVGSSTRELAVDGRAWKQWNALPGALNLLADGLVYPEYGLGRAGSSQRTFGYPSSGGFWTASGNYTTPEAIRWSDMTGVRAGKPEGLDFPNPSWIAKRSPHFFEPIGATQYFRRAWTSYTDNIPYQILATADNYLTLWLDGEQIVTPDAQGGLSWNQLVQVTGNLPAGAHVLAAKVVNGGRATSGSPLALLVTMQQTQSNGDVVVGPPLINSDRSWHVADNVPGFQRADVLVRLYREARTRGAAGFLILSRGFGTETDTAGVPWLDAPGEHALDVMSTVLDAQQVLCETGMDVWVDPELMDLQAFVKQGTDRYSTVRPDLGVDGGTILAHEIAEQAPKFNTALLQLADGKYVEEQDAASVAAYGRLEVGLSMGSTSQTDTAAQTAAAQFAESAGVTLTFTTELPAGHGPQPFTDFFLGDFIGVPDGAGGYTKVRVMAITVDASAEQIRVTPELQVEAS